MSIDCDSSVEDGAVPLMKGPSSKVDHLIHQLNASEADAFRTTWESSKRSTVPSTSTELRIAYEHFKNRHLYRSSEISEAYEQDTEVQS